MTWQWPTLLIAGAIVLFAYRYGRPGRGCLPPGPPPLPVIGNALDFPRRHLGRELRELSLKYGDVVYLKVLGQSIVLLGSYEAACELFEKRSTNYSDRPESVMVKLTNLDWIFVFKNYGPEWRRYRRAVHGLLQPTMVTQYQPVLSQIAHNLLYGLLANPDDFSYHIKFAFAASIVRIVYGVDLTTGDKTHYKLVKKLATIAEDISTPGRHVVEAFPFLQRLPAWAPGTGFKRLAQDWKKELYDIRDRLFDSAQEEMRKNGVKDSAITRLIEAGEDEELVRNLTATMYAAGADTTNSSIHAFILAMALHPDVQKKAQAELDAVVGSDRLPDFTDQGSLLYLNALTKEVLRWHAIAPIGVPHRSVDDDFYKDSLIPGGSIVMANQWALSRDESLYPDPEHFSPERFLHDDESTPDAKDPFNYAFGFGRRGCPGKDFAGTAMFIICASILHTFQISPPLDGDGNPKTMDVWMGNHLAVSHPDPFECRIVPRDTQREALVRAAVP